MSWGGSFWDTDPPYLKNVHLWLSGGATAATLTFQWKLDVNDIFSGFLTYELFVLDGVEIDFVTDATVGNRRLKIEIQDGGDVYFQQVCAQPQAASLTRRYSWGPGGATGNVSAQVRETLPTSPLVMREGFVLSMTPETIVSAGDRLTAKLRGRLLK